MHSRWQLLVVMALALSAFGGDNNSATEPSVATAISTTTIHPATTTEAIPASGQERIRRVAPGDNLWTIARDQLVTARSGGAGEPTQREVAAYWVKVIRANRTQLASGDPDLIYPGERIVLPPVD